MYVGHDERSGSEPDSRPGCPVASTLATESLGSGKTKFLNSPRNSESSFTRQDKQCLTHGHLPPGELHVAPHVAFIVINILTRVLNGGMSARAPSFPTRARHSLSDHGLRKGVIAPCSRRRAYGLGGRKPHGPIKFCCCCCSCGAGIEVCWACASISKNLFCHRRFRPLPTLTVRLHVRPTDHNPHCVTVLTRYRHIVRVLLSCAWWRRRTIPCTSAFCRALWGSHHPPPSLYLHPTSRPGAQNRQAKFRDSQGSSPELRA